MLNIYHEIRTILILVFKLPFKILSRFKKNYSSEDIMILVFELPFKMLIKLLSFLKI
jgi:hypothetical protein